MNKPYSVLIAEDELLLARSMEAFLKMHGFFVKTCENGKQARLALLKGGFDLLITDLSLPVINGFDLIKEAGQLEMGNRIIVISGDHAEEHLHKKVRYIKKPFSLSDLLRCVNKCLKQDKEKCIIQG